MDEKFKDNEFLLRAVWPPNRRPDFWVNGRLSSAAFKDSAGLSVNRTGDLSLEEVVNFTSKRFRGRIVSVTTIDCNFVHACLRYKPSKENELHSEIHGSETEIVLSDEQALILARRATIEYIPNSEYMI